MSPRVVQIGNFLPAHATEQEIRQGFVARGWQVEALQEDWLKDADEAGWASVADLAASSDLLVYTRTWGLPDDRARALWAHCAAHGVPTAAIHLDLFYGLASPKGPYPRHEMPARDAMFACAFVFTPDGDHDDEWERDGVNHWWLPPAIGPDSCFDGEPDPERWGAFDVAFVGSGHHYHPEYPHRLFLVKELHRRFGPRFVHVGGDGNYPGMRSGEALRGPDLHRFYASVPVIVGDSCWVDVKPPSTRFWSDRVMEVWGRGGFLLMPRVVALHEHLQGFVPGWEPWDDFDAMEEAVRSWLARPTERETVRKKWVKHVRAHHTWTQRLGQMLDIIGLED